MELKKCDEKGDIFGYEADIYVTNTGCRILITKESGYHLSISHPNRYPNWDEIKNVRYKLLPNNKTYGLLLPPKEEYVNAHPNCFHLHEIREDRIIRLEG